MNNYEWLNSIYPIKSENWHFEKVIRVSDIENVNFYKHNKSFYRSRIKTSFIKGIDYAYAYNCFSDITWIELLNNLKRFKQIKAKNSSFGELVAHAMSDYNEPRTVLKYDSIYITSCGQHRMALAKFLNIEEVEVEVIEYHFDFMEYEKYLTKKSCLNLLWKEGLIEENQYQIALLDTGSLISLNMGPYHLLINDHLLKPLIDTVQGLSTNAIYLQLDKLRVNTISNTRIIDIRDNTDLKNFKPLLRILKSHLKKEKLF